MLKRFLFQLLTSFTGAAAALLLGAVLIALIVGGIISGFTGSSDDAKAEMKAGSILSISLDGEIAECEKAFTPSLSMLFTGTFEAPQTLKRISEALDEAAANKDVTAVYLECGDLAAAAATLDALRKKIIDFRKATNGQKPVYPYAENFTQGAYFVDSSADSIFMCPEGQFELSGLAVSAFYYKELLDQAGVKMQVSKVGTYKSAVEPYLLEHISEPARAQLDLMNVNIWAYIKDNISASRPSITPELIDSLVSRDHITFARPDICMVIFTTAYSEYAVEGFELEALDYLVKPIDPQRFNKAVDRALAYRTLAEKSSAPAENVVYIIVRADRKYVRLRLEEILYVEGLKDYLVVHLADRNVVTPMTVKAIEESDCNRPRISLRCSRCPAKIVIEG